jgi:hypothetical protein
LLTHHSEFSLTAFGASVAEANGIVGELFDGQNRIGQTNLPIPKAKYSLDSHGREFIPHLLSSIPSLTHLSGIWDSKDRGCILTPPTTQ